MPPSSRTIFNVIAHILTSLGFKVFGTGGDGAEAVWYPDANAGFNDTEDVAAIWMGIEAVAMDNRDRTKSRGYVEPAHTVRLTRVRRGK